MSLVSVYVLLGVSVPFINSAVPDVYSQEPGGFLPGPVQYFSQKKDQVVGGEGVQDNSLSDRPQQPRLGYPLYSGTTLNGYTPTTTSMYSPLKLDLGGLLLGTVVGLGAVLLIPKLLHVFSYSGHSYNHYGRNDDDSLSTSLNEIMSRVDQSLAEHNINTTSCLQRALCSSLQTPPETSMFGSMISAATRSHLVSFLMEGSRIQQAVDVGKAGQSCPLAFPQCPINQDSIATGLQALISSLQTRPESPGQL